jgi:hypothetical protein
MFAGCVVGHGLVEPVLLAEVLVAVLPTVVAEVEVATFVPTPPVPPKPVDELEATTVVPAPPKPVDVVATVATSIAVPTEPPKPVLVEVLSLMT